MALISCCAANCRASISVFRSKSIFRRSASRAKSSEPRVKANSVLPSHSWARAAVLEVIGLDQLLLGNHLSRLPARLTNSPRPCPGSPVSSVRWGSSEASRIAFTLVRKTVEIRSSMPILLLSSLCSHCRGPHTVPKGSYPLSVTVALPAASDDHTYTDYARPSPCPTDNLTPASVSTHSSAPPAPYPSPPRGATAGLPSPPSPRRVGGR